MAPTLGPWAQTVGPYLPFQPVVRGSTGRIDVSVDTAGQVTLAGQSISLTFMASFGSINRNVGPALPFQPIVRGFTASPNVNISIDTAGQVTLTGQSIQVDVQSPRISAVKWDPGP